MFSNIPPPGAGYGLVSTTPTLATWQLITATALSGDITGPESATIVSFVNGIASTSISAGAIIANSATFTNTANRVVLRDGGGNFAANAITASLVGNADTTSGFKTSSAPVVISATSPPGAGYILITNTSTSAIWQLATSGSLGGDVTGLESANTVSKVGGQFAANIASGVIAANAASSANIPSTIVSRDASGNFVANAITASLVGNADTTSGFKTTGSPVVISGASPPPGAGYILITNAPTSATWQ